MIVHTMLFNFFVLSLSLFCRSAHAFHRDVTVQLFQWSHLDVAKECEKHLGPAGYRWVQISPPQEHKSGDAWWVDYQPVSYILHSKRGTEKEFATMVKRCNAAKVGVIVDAVFNHMTGGPAGIGSAGTRYDHYEYPNLYNYSDFHHCGRNSDDVIKDYNDRYEVQNCELVGLADLATGTLKVQDAIAAYLNKLVQLGVSGFRVDAAKHMPTQDVRAILGRITHLEPLRVIQEVTYGRDEPIQPEEYLQNGNVHVFLGASDIKRLFTVDGMAHLLLPIAWGPGWGRGYLPSSNSTIFVTNHDLEREKNVLLVTDPQYFLAHLFILTWTYGQVDVFSGYNFTNFDDGPPSARVTCGKFGWRCEHRHPMILGAIQIRGLAGSEPVENIITSGPNRTAYSRGSLAFVAINNEPQDWLLPSGTVTGMKEGIYTDVLGSQAKVEVDHNGKVEANVTILAFSAIGIHHQSSK